MSEFTETVRKFLEKPFFNSFFEHYSENRWQIGMERFSGLLYTKIFENNDIL
jgi:hypothetical protein